MVSERYGVPPSEAELERRRLDHLAAARDPRTFRLLHDLGLGSGARAWEVGAGAGTVAAWIGEQVGPTGSVWSTDIDLTNHHDVEPHVTVEQHDLVHDEIPVGVFDFVHARAVLQHISERDAVLPRIVASLRPGGAVLVEESDFQAFGTQKLPEPLATLHRAIDTFQPKWREPNYGARVPFELRSLGCDDVTITADSWVLRPHESSGEWWFLAVERIGPRLVEAGVVTQLQFEQSMEQMRSPGFSMIGPLSIATSARVPK